MLEGKKQKPKNGYFWMICNNFIKKHPMTGNKKNIKNSIENYIYGKNSRFFVMFHH